MSNGNRGYKIGTLTKGYTFGTTELVTNAKLHSLVDSATITGIVDADMTNVNISKSVVTSGAAGDVLYHNGTNLIRLAKGDDTNVLTLASGVPSWASKTGTINFIIEGYGSAISTGVKGDLQIDFACTINSVTLLADQSGSIVVDIWKDTYANFPPDNDDSITASAPATITTATKSTDATLTGWTTTITSGDVLRFNVDSITTCERVTVALKYTR